jgi:hypothetical protein
MCGDIPLPEDKRQAQPIRHPVDRLCIPAAFRPQVMIEVGDSQRVPQRLKHQKQAEAVCSAGDGRKDLLPRFEEILAPDKTSDEFWNIRQILHRTIFMVNEMQIHFRFGRPFASHTREFLASDEHRCSSLPSLRIHPCSKNKTEQGYSARASGGQALRVTFSCILSRSDYFESEKVTSSSGASISWILFVRTPFCARL